MADHIHSFQKGETILAYDSTLMSGLIKKLNSAQKNLADAQGETDFYLRLIAQTAQIFGPTVPDVLDNAHRQTILALVRKISDERSTIVQMPVTNGKGGH